MPEVLNSKSVKGFIKGSLVLIGLFFVLSCVVAVIVLNFGDKFEISKNIENVKTDKEKSEGGENNGIGKKIVIDKKYIIGKNNCTLIFILVVPLIVFLLVFFKISCLVKSYYEKLYGNDGVVVKINALEKKIQNFETQNFEKHKHKMQEIKAIIEACQILAKTIKPDSEKKEDALNKLLEKILEIFSKKCSEDKSNGDSCDSGN